MENCYLFKELVRYIYICRWATVDEKNAYSVQFLTLWSDEGREDVANLRYGHKGEYLIFILN